MNFWDSAACEARHCQGTFDSSNKDVLVVDVGDGDPGGQVQDQMVVHISCSEFPRSVVQADQVPMIT